METRRTVGIIFGGRSPEHEVSLASARGILTHLDQKKYSVVLCGVDRQGRPRTGGVELIEGGLDRGEGVVVRWPVAPGDRTLREESTGRGVCPPLDVVIPIVHGSGGEDGTLQGVFALAGIPCVGPGVLGSALAMDKDRSRRVLAAAGLPVVRDAVFEGPAAVDAKRVAEGVRELAWPLFVKPARAGSSVGISKVTQACDLAPALRRAYAVDTKIVVEEAVPQAREIEVAVLGNLDPEASIPGEIRPQREFYDYEAKYHDAQSALLVPAPLSADQAALLQRMAVAAFRALDLAGLSRVDFLLAGSGARVVVNEVNTLPGFTPISMYPRLWEASGLPYPRLLDRLIELALEASSFGPLSRPNAASLR